MASRDNEIRDVVGRLDTLLAALRTNVDTLTEILDPPPGTEVPEPCPSP